ncbi:hypothetical protein CDAR_80481 [Caerostris darwini]|uniref:Uncharacterized protein n=1 Tax=Caerostris darwini TaxID=1538125 RepID=A0AAV4X3H9_9ARAC|nr:hypothetical protein CDAR_80481 [Caerostris darwini]
MLEVLITKRDTGVTVMYMDSSKSSLTTRSISDSTCKTCHDIPFTLHRQFIHDRFKSDFRTSHNKKPNLLNQVGMESRLLVQLKACSNLYEHTFHIEEAPHHVETMGCPSHLMEHTEISLVEPDRYFTDYMQGGENMAIFSNLKFQRKSKLSLLVHI